MSKDTPVLQCEACGHQNEPERVYCHNCGQKLDRSLLPKQQSEAIETDAQKRRRVKKMMNVSGRGAFKRAVKTLISVLIFAALVAAVFLYWQKPEGVPPRNPNTLPDRNAGDIWQRLMAAPGTVATDLSEDEINAFLRNSLKAADSAIPGIKFERAFVTIRDGTIRVTAERSAWGLSMYSSTTYAPRVNNDTVTFDVVGVHFGKLGVDPRIPFVPGLGLDGVRKAMENEIANLKRLKSVQAQKLVMPGENAPRESGSIKLITKPAQ